MVGGGLDDDPLSKQLESARTTHLQAIERLEAILSSLDVEADMVSLPNQADATGYDLVISLGGDGTVLHTSHQIGNTPVLALNSAPGATVSLHHRKLPAADSITPIMCQRSGTAWQKA